MIYTFYPISPAPTNNYNATSQTYNIYIPGALPYGNQWGELSRNFQADISALTPGVTYNYIWGVWVYGSGVKIDNLTLFDIAN